MRRCHTADANPLDSSFNPGRPLQDDPKWSASASLVYRHPLTDQFALTARADTTYVGGRKGTTWAGIDLSYRFK